MEAESNFELAVASKQTEIAWKQADLLAAQRALALVSGFLSDYDGKATDLSHVRTQLASADSQLASIQQSNVVKLTIRMGIETYNTISETIALGQTAAGALVTNGLSSTVGNVAFDQLTGSLSKEAQTALGMDSAHLSSPRTVKIKAVSDAARAAYPDLARVQQTMALSLEAVQSAAYHEDGTELGETGAILRKNIMVRAEIAAALGKLETLGTETASAKTEAESRLPDVQADVDRIAAELLALRGELEELKAQWRESEAVARAAENASALVPPVTQTPPVVVVVREEEETDEEYAARVQAARIAAALAVWDAQAPPILAAIANAQVDVAAGHPEISNGIAAAVDEPQVPAFIATYGTSDKVDANATASYGGSISGYVGIQNWVDLVTPSQAALSSLIGRAEALADLYTTLANGQNRLVGLREMLETVGAPIPVPYYAAMNVPGMGQAAAEDLAAYLGQLRSMLPLALTNAQAQLDQLAAATEAWGSGIGIVRADIDDNLAAAQSAMAELIARAQAWETALAAADGLVHDFATGNQHSRLGYFSGETFVPVVKHSFDLEVYKTSLLAAITTTGSGGFNAARDLRTRYETLIATAAELKEPYDLAWQRYRAAYARVHTYTSSTLDFPVLEDWRSAAAFSSAALPVDASGVTDQATRFRSLYHTSNQMPVTSLTGGDPVVGQPVLNWAGIPRMRQLPDPGLDEIDAYLPHRLLAVKQELILQGPSWLALPHVAFSANYTRLMNEMFAISAVADDTADSAVEPVVISLFGELGDLHDAYLAAHPIPVITTQPASVAFNIPAGTTVSTTLSVTAVGDAMTYQWYSTTSLDLETSWTLIPDATSRTYPTPELNANTYYRVHITNAAGTVVSAPALVAVYQIYPTPVFTSAGHASAQVGVAFTWTFTTDIPSWINAMPYNLPPGLNFEFMFGRISGTPTEAGTYDLTVMAINNGSMAEQSFRLVVEAGTLAPFDRWTRQWTDVAQRQNPAFTQFNGQPAGDGIANALKFAFNLIGEEPDQVASLDAPCSHVLSATGRAGLPCVGVDSGGRLTLLYVRRKTATKPGISYAVEFSSTLAADSWAENPGATEQVTSIDETWERVMVTDSAPSGGSRFVRVRLTRP